MHCPGCGLILGKEPPREELCCPRCRRPQRLRAFARADGLDAEVTVPIEGDRKRFVAVYVSEAWLRFDVAQRSRRPEAWETLLPALEAEQLKAAAKAFDWVLAAVHVDPGAHADEAKRPFPALEKDVAEGVVNSILVSDFDRLPRKDVLRLFDLVSARGLDLLALAPHPPPAGLRLEDVDYGRVAEIGAQAALAARFFTPEAEAALGELLATAGWHWTAYAADLLAGMAGREALRDWQAAEPLCRARPWREVLTRVAVDRVRRGRLLDRLAVPALLACGFCRGLYLSSALPLRLMEVGLKRPPACGECLGRAFPGGAGDPALALGPAELDRASDCDSAVAYLRGLDTQAFRALVQAAAARAGETDARGRPRSPSDLWLAVLRDLGHLAGLGEVQPTDVLYRAADGHLLPSRGAALLDNWLHARGVGHRPDARYPVDPELNPEGTSRADLVAGETRIEFLGVRGRDEQGKDIGARLEVCRRAGLPLVAVFAEDLLTPAVLERKMAPVLSAEVAGSLGPADGIGEGSER